jgi:hypothetical protein
MAHIASDQELLFTIWIDQQITGLTRRVSGKWDRFNPRKERCSERECCDRQMFNCALRDSHRELDELRRNVSLEVTEIRVLPESDLCFRNIDSCIWKKRLPGWRRERAADMVRMQMRDENL